MKYGVEIWYMVLLYFYPFFTQISYCTCGMRVFKDLWALNWYLPPIRSNLLKGPAIHVIHCPQQIFVTRPGYDERHEINAGPCRAKKKS